MASGFLKAKDGIEIKILRMMSSEEAAQFISI